MDGIVYKYDSSQQHQLVYATLSRVTKLQGLRIINEIMIFVSIMVVGSDVGIKSGLSSDWFTSTRVLRHEKLATYLCQAMVLYMSSNQALPFLGVDPKVPIMLCGVFSFDILRDFLSHSS